MAKRIILISSFPVCIVLAALAIVFVGIGRSQPAAGVSIESARTQVFSLIEADKWSEADAAVDKLIADYSGDADLPSSIASIADTYCWRRKYDGADRLYRVVLDKSPESVLAVKARLGISRVEILNLIGQKEYEDANQRIDSMIIEFKDEPDIAVALFHIGQELFWQRQFGEARDAFDRGVELYPNGPAAREMKLWSAKTGCCVLIYGRRATDAEVVAAIDKMLNDFNDDPGLPGAVYWLSKEYEWTKGTSLSRDGWYDKPNSVYQQIMQKFSDTPFGQQAELDQKRLNHRMKIFNLMKESDQNAIDVAIEEMVADLPFDSAQGRQEVAGELYWLACGFEEKDNGPDAMRMYERIIKDYPDTPEANSAALDVRRRVITDLINAGYINGSEVLMDEFIADFNEHPNAGSCLGRVAIGYYKKGLGFKEKRKFKEAKEYFDRADDVFQKIIMNNLEKEKDVGALYYHYAARTYQELWQWEKAIANYQKVVDKYPDFEYACGAQAAVGWCYEFMIKAGEIAKEQAEPLIEQAYNKVLTNFTDCYLADYAAYHLAEMSEQKGDKTAAAEYYRMFLDIANRRPGGPQRAQDFRIAEAEAKLAELEGNK